MRVREWFEDESVGYPGYISAGADPSGMDRTTISVPEDLVDELSARKRPDESYADVIRRLIDQTDDETDTAETDEGGNGTEDDDPTPVTEERTVAEQDPRMSTGATLAELIETVADETTPESGEHLEERREAVRAVVAYLRERGSAAPADLRGDVYPDHPAGYTEGEDPARSWWENAVRPALRALADRTDAVREADRSDEWIYSADGDD